MKNKTYYKKRIEKALSFINKNLGEDIQISEVAEVARLSKFHFLRIYKEIQNETPYETILRLRLEKALFLFKTQPQKKVIEVALECGFNSIENFSRQFKARHNITATDFKNKNITK